MSKTIFRFFLFFLAWIGSGALLLFIFGVLLGFLQVGYIAPLGMMLVVPVVAISRRNVSRRNALTIATYVEQAVRLNVPIPQILKAAERSEGSSVRLQLRDVRELIEQGVPLHRAMAESLTAMSNRSVGLLGAAERINRLPQTLRRIVEQGRRRMPKDTATGAFYLAYPITMILFLTVVVTLICVFVLPKYEQIFKDFHIQLPAVTIWLLDFVRDVGPIFGVLAIVVALAYLGRAWWEAVRPLGPSLQMSRGISDWIESIIPPTRGILRDRDWADALGVIAEGLDGGLPLPDAINEATKLHTGRYVHETLERWSSRLAQGQDLPNSAKLSGAPRGLAGMLATAHGADTADVFRFFERFYRARFSRTKIVLQALFVPVMVFIFAIPVLWVALSIFVPLIELISVVSPMKVRL